MLHSQFAFFRSNAMAIKLNTPALSTLPNCLRAFRLWCGTYICQMCLHQISWHIAPEFGAKTLIAIEIYTKLTIVVTNLFANETRRVKISKHVVLNNKKKKLRRPWPALRRRYVLVACAHYSCANWRKVHTTNSKIPHKLNKNQNFLCVCGGVSTIIRK